MLIKTIIKPALETLKELKHEMIDMFRHAIDELKEELKSSSSAKPISVKKNILGSMF